MKIGDRVVLKGFDAAGLPVEGLRGVVTAMFNFPSLCIVQLNNSSVEVFQSQCKRLERK